MAENQLPLRTAELRLVTAATFSVPGQAFPESGTRTLPRHVIKIVKEPKISLTIYTKVCQSDLYVELTNITVKRDVWVEYTVTKSLRSNKDDPASWQRPELCEQNFLLVSDGQTPTVCSIYGLGRQHWVQVTLKIYAPLPHPPMGTLARGLQKARLEGGSPKCDAVLIASDGTEVRGHRLVLVACSEVFANMFDSGLKEAADGRVEIGDVSGEALKKFVEYLYTEAVQDWAGLELELLRMADKYFVQALREDCELRMGLVDGPRALALLEEGGDGPLLGSALRRLILIIANDMSDVIKSPAWTAFKDAHPLIADTLQVCCSSSSSAVQWPGCE